MAKTASSGAPRRYQGARDNKKNNTKDALIRHEFLGILMYGITVLLLVVMIMSTNEFTPLYSVKQFLKGLFGSMLFSAPIVTALTGFWVLKARGDKKLTKKNVFTTLIVYLFLLTMIEAFSIETISQKMNYTSYMNFMSFAFFRPHRRRRNRRSSRMAVLQLYGQNRRNNDQLACNHPYAVCRRRFFH